MSLIVTVITPKFKLLMGDKNRFDNRGRKTSEVQKVVLFKDKYRSGLMGAIGNSEHADKCKSSWIRCGIDMLSNGVGDVQYITLFNFNNGELPENLQLNIFDGTESVKYNVSDLNDTYFVYGLGQGADYAMGYFDAMFEDNKDMTTEDLVTHVEDLFEKVNKLYPQVSKEFDMINL